MAAEDLPLGTHTTYAVQVTHDRNEGIVTNPIAGPAPQNASVVRLHAPFERIVVHWTAVSEGKPPTLPSHKSFLQNLNRCFLDGERVGIVYPTIVGHVWMCAGAYSYQVMAPEGLTSMLPLSMVPWEDDVPYNFYIPAENFDTGILNPVYNQPTGTAPDPDVMLLDAAIDANP